MTKCDVDKYVAAIAGDCRVNEVEVADDPAPALPSHPLTGPQRDIWIEQSIHPDVPLYNIGGYLSIDGPLDVQRFEQTVQMLVQRHDNLRTLLIAPQGPGQMARQAIADKLDAKLELHDLSRSAEPAAVALALMQSQASQGFALYGRPLFRFALLKLAPNRWYFAASFHHLIVDGWATTLVHRSLSEIYNALSAAASKPGAAPSYLDYVADDRNFMASDTRTRQIKYWQAKYVQLPEPLFERRSAAAAAMPQISPSACHSSAIEHSQYQHVADLAKACGVSIFHVLLGVTAVLFARISQRDCFTFGLPLLNRGNAKWKATCGLFAGISPVLFEVNLDQAFPDLVASITRTLKQDYRHQRMPIGDLLHAIGSNRGGRRMFDFSLSYEPHNHDLDFDGASASTVAVLNGWQQTPLTLFVREFHTGADIKLDWVYNLGWFDAVSAGAFADRWALVLRQILAEPTGDLRRLDVLGEAERHRVLVEWNETKRECPQELCIHELFEQQAQRTPQAARWRWSTKGSA